MLRVAYGVIIMLSIAAVFGIWQFGQAKISASPSFIESFAHRKLQEKLKDADYFRYDGNVVMKTVYNNRYLVSGQATAIRIGKTSASSIPTTEFEKISYALIISVKCARLVLGDCLEVRRIHVRSVLREKPVI